MNKFIIKECEYDKVLLLRREVMYPDKEIDYVRVEGDNDKNGNTIHLGLFLIGSDQISKTEPISVVSLFINRENSELQFRKFATKVIFQNMGYGKQLLEYALDLHKQQNDYQIKRIWCNARVEKSDFYINKFNFKKTTKTYTKSGIDFIILEKFI